MKISPQGPSLEAGTAAWGSWHPARSGGCGGSADPCPPTRSHVPFSTRRTRSPPCSAPGTGRGARTLPGGLCSCSGFGLEKEKCLPGVKYGPALCAGSLPPAPTKTWCLLGSLTTPPVASTPKQNQPWASLSLTLSLVSSGPGCFTGLQDGLMLLGCWGGPGLGMEAGFCMCLQDVSSNRFAAWKGGEEPNHGLKCCFVGLWVDLIGSACAGAAKHVLCPAR